MDLVRELALLYGQFCGRTINPMSEVCFPLFFVNAINVKQILHGFSFVMSIYLLKVNYILRGAVKWNIILPRVDKSYIQQEWTCNIDFITYQKNLHSIALLLHDVRKHTRPTFYDIFLFFSTLYIYNENIGACNSWSIRGFTLHHQRRC